MLTIPGKLILFVELHVLLSSQHFVTYSSIMESSTVEFHGSLCEFHVIFVTLHLYLILCKRF
jgi:hypothetical protein